MDKQDIMYLVAGIVIVLVLAFIVKPAITGEEVSLGLWDQGDDAEVEAYEETMTATLEPLPTAPPVTTPVPTPTWSGDVESLSFVDPSIYDVEFATPKPVIEPPHSPPPVTNWTTYMTLEGTTSGTTGIFSIPYNKWRIKYSVTPMNPEFSTFDLEIRDAMNPNKFVGEISIQNYEFVEVPEYESVTEEVELSSGDVVERVWDEMFGGYVYPTSAYTDTSSLDDVYTEINTEDPSTSSSSHGVAYGSVKTIEFEDPNSDIGSITTPQNVVPSSRTVEDSMVIREGNGEYYLVIDTLVIDSYTIEIDVPA